jgi:hypothetical protein
MYLQTPRYLGFLEGQFLLRNAAIAKWDWESLHELHLSRVKMVFYQSSHAIKKLEAKEL